SGCGITAAGTAEQNAIQIFIPGDIFPCYKTAHTVSEQIHRQTGEPAPDQDGKLTGIPYQTIPSILGSKISGAIHSGTASMSDLIMSADYKSMFCQILHKFMIPS